MNILSSLFGGGNSAENDARQLMRQVEQHLDREGPLMAVKFMASEEFAQLRRQYWPSKLVGPSGPLHDEFIALLAKIKAKGESEFGGR